MDTFYKIADHLNDKDIFLITCTGLWVHGSKIILNLSGIRESYVFIF